MIPLITIFGPTAAGKSKLALALGEAIGGEIVTADSRQLYRFMDIGTDKPTKADQARVPHHMIDLVDPDEPYTLATYQEGATKTISEIAARGNLPVLAGGTPLYVNAVIEGWTIPRVEPNIEFRLSLEREAQADGSEALHRRLAELDPPAAQKILPSNTRRIVRALEVIEVTGRPISEQQNCDSPPYAILRIGLQCERAELYRRIDERVESQFDRGLVDEVAGLYARGYSFELPSMSGLGYRQVGDYLLGRATLAEAKQRIKWDTHAFVRHQANWFKRATETHWLDVTNAKPTETALALADAFLQSYQG